MSQPLSTVAIVQSAENHAAESTIRLGFAFGHFDFCPGGTTIQDTYLSALFRSLDNIVFYPGDSSSDPIGSGTVLRTPSKTAGIGSIDVECSEGFVPQPGNRITFEVIS